MLPLLEESYGNPSSVHRFGSARGRRWTRPAGALATLVGCNDSDLLFTRGGTESINTAVRGILTRRVARAIASSRSTVEALRDARALAFSSAQEAFEIVEIPCR
jgi:cysteine desulfurase